MTRTGEKGVALVFTLFLMAALSAMAVSIMFLAQTETSASRNYKTMSQARYAGEAGVHRAIHYLSSTTYTSLVTSTAGFDTTVSPVKYNNQPVILTPINQDPCPTGQVCSNHPNDTIKTAYAALFGSTAMSVGSGATVTYSAKATLLSMRLVNVYGGGTGVVQTWRIDATGTVPGALAANVEVAALMERDSAPAETYAIFATGSGCGAITMSGNVHTDSYDSSAMATTPPPTQSYGGGVGTNGNLRISGQVAVNGNLDTPRTGVGNCTNSQVTALEGSGSATVTGDTIQLPQAKTYQTPAAPNPVPPTTNTNVQSSTTCFNLGWTPAPPLTMPTATCTKTTSGSSSTITITANGSPLVFGNVTLNSNTNLVIDSGIGGLASPVTFNVNSIVMSGGASLSLAANTTVTMGVRGQGVTGDVVDFTGGSFANSSFDPSRFQILYAGTGTMKFTGGSQTAMTVYAPNSSVSMHGSADFYGSILSGQFTDTGGASVHYDRSLASKFNVLGNHVMSSFSWQKY